MAITLTPVCPENRALAQALELYPHQLGFVESVTECMEEADQCSAWRPVCIVLENHIIGFSMYGYFGSGSSGRLWFDRLLLDRRWQGRGLGREAIQVILEQMLREYGPRDIYLSVYEDNPHAIALYKSFGFRFTGELDTHGEKVMVLPLQCQE